MSGRVLVVDDEPQILRALQTNLRGAGYEVDVAATARDALSAAALRPPDAVILDLILPDGSGTDVCRELRRWTAAPILVLSAVGEEPEKVAALDAGADDYVTKPFGVDELQARIHAVLLRAAGPNADAKGRLRLGPIVLDIPRHAVRVGSRPVHLTPREFALLKALLENRGRVVTRARLLRAVWGEAYVEETAYLHVYVNRLRRKLEAADPTGATRGLIVAEPGIGYRVADPEAAGPKNV